jgi:hypothetical protein
VAKTRKKSSAKKPSGGKKAAGKKKATRKTTRASAKELDLRPLKKQLRSHIDKLKSGKSADVRVQSAIANLSRLHDELNADCNPTMTIPLE